MEVVTLTGNLLAEWTIEVIKLQSGKTHRAERMEFQVGGKGVNVSRILRHLGVETEAHGFAGGALAEYCTVWLQNHNVAHRFYPLEQGVRPGMVVRESGNPESAETTFLGLDLAVPTSSWETALEEISKIRPAWLAICGSIPGWQKSWLDSVQRIIFDKQVEICVDSYGAPLEDLITLPIELVKVNRNELERLLPEMAGRSTLDLLAEISETSPVHNWIITDGPNPILAAFQNGELYEVKPAKVEEVSAMGSGDTFLASLLQQSMTGANPMQMLRQAAACATANAASQGIAEFELPIASHFFPRISKI